MTTQLPARRLFVSPGAASRLRVAREWLAERGTAEPLLVVAPTLDAAAGLVRQTLSRRGEGAWAAFGWHRETLATLAGRLAEPVLAGRGVAPISGLALEALCAHVIAYSEAGGELGAYTRIADRPGFPRAAARTFAELGQAGVAVAGMDEIDVDLGDRDLANLYRSYRDTLARQAFADRAATLEAAIARVEEGRDAFVGAPLLLLDVPVWTELEARLVRALIERAPSCLATVVRGDRRTARLLEGALAPWAECASNESAKGSTALERLQQHLFERGEHERPRKDELDQSVALLSAPGESRECVEIARCVLQEAARGTPFDRMAVVLRSHEQYRDHLHEALSRAGIPSYFGRGTTRPDPAGRALLALLACKQEGLSATRFAEYLSLGCLPRDRTRDTTGAAPPHTDVHWVPPDGELGWLDRGREGRVEEPATEQAEEATLPTPRRWERMLVDASVIGRGRRNRPAVERWERRLRGLRASFEDRLAAAGRAEEPGAALVESLERRIGELDALMGFALPLVAELDALPASATWRVWLERLGAIATRAIARPDRVLATLAELSPMADVGPVGLAEVQRVLAPRLGELVERPRGGSAGKLLVSTADDVRGRELEVVFVPGLAEKLFPKKVAQDPLCPDELRRKVSPLLTVTSDRVLAERLALRVAVGAATRKVVLSYPRLDAQLARPRVPSFYGLEVLRAAEGELSGFGELARRAQQTGAVRMGWPAPERPEDAIDEAELDLVMLSRLLDQPPEVTRGAARYLIEQNRHLARSLRHRWQRWQSSAWTAADGLVAPEGAAAAELERRRLDRHPYSPTALERYARCPYQFYLYSIARLSPHARTTEPIEEMDAMQRGALVHEVLQATLSILRERHLLPVTGQSLDAARAVLDATLAEVADRYAERLAPAIPRVWKDAVAAIGADLTEWLLGMTEEPAWVPRSFELGFGVPIGDGMDPASTAEPVEVAGVRLRGVIDLVEQRGDALRATDFKTGSAWVPENAVVHGGQVLQPLLYAMALEALLVAGRGPAGREVVEGRLYYCTQRGGYEERPVPCNDRTRAAAAQVVAHIARAVEAGKLVAAPAEGACDLCDYRPVCGPYEQSRQRRKKKLAGLCELRRQV